jgi:uncharacterized protein YbaR (Trm112 family)
MYVYRQCLVTGNDAIAEGARRMVNKELLDILCCPETKQDVRLIEGEIIEKINSKIKDGELKNRGGENVTETIDAGLVREDNKFLYPIREDIPIMLIDEGIPFDEWASDS